MVGTASHPHGGAWAARWPDAHLYAAGALVLGAALAAAHATLLWVVPVRFSAALPAVLHGLGGPTGIALAAVGAALAVWSYRERSLGAAFAAATFVGLTFGALGVSTILALAALALLLARRGPAPSA